MSKTTTIVIAVVIIVLIIVAVWYFLGRPSSQVQAAVVTTPVSLPPVQVPSTPSYPPLFVGKLSPYAQFNGQTATILKYQKIDGLIYMVILLPNQSLVGVVDNVNIYSWLSSVPQTVTIRVS